MTPPKIKRRKITDYIPDNHNANAGSERGLQMIEDSLQQDGVGRSLVADANDRIPAGNKTLEAAVNAGITDVIEIETDGKALIVHKRTDWDLDDLKGSARRYAYRDNRASQVSLTWDANVIAADIEAGVNLGDLWTGAEMDILLGIEPPAEERYSRKIDIPIYEPTNDKPDIAELFDDSRTKELLAEIDSSDLTSDEKRFLTIAAQRHTVLHFARIADLYAHGSAALQRLMENSALVIIDYNRAIELGYAKLTKQIAEMVAEEND